MTTMDQIHRIRELYYEQDKNLNEIAIIMGCDWRTVRKYVDMEDFNSPPPAPASLEMANLPLMQESTATPLRRRFANPS